MAGGSCLEGLGGIVHDAVMVLVTVVSNFVQLCVVLVFNIVVQEVTWTWRFALAFFVQWNEGSS